MIAKSGFIAWKSNATQREPIIFLDQQRISLEFTLQPRTLRKGDYFSLFFLSYWDGIKINRGNIDLKWPWYVRAHKVLQIVPRRKLIKAKTHTNTQIDIGRVTSDNHTDKLTSWNDVVAI